MSSAAHDAVESQATMKRRKKHRREKVWFMKGAAWAVDRSYHLPITDEGMRHFMWGADCVREGRMAINDISSFHQHIEALQSGHIPA